MSMDSRQRVMRTFDRQPTDVIPVTPFMFDLAATVYGIQVGEFASSGSKMAAAQLALHAELQQDVIFIGADNYYIAEGFGCVAGMPVDEIPHLEKPAVSDLDEVYGLKVPDPLTDGRMPVMLEATRLVRAAVGDSVAIRTPGTGPFALASYFIGTQKFLVEVGRADRGQAKGRPEAIHHALDLAADALIAFGKACFDAGSDILHCGDSLSSCDMISPAQYERWAFPYQQKVIRAWKDYGAKTLLHICGDSTKVLHLYAETGADVVEIDFKVDLGYAKSVIGDKTCIMGNVDTVSALLLGTPEKVRQASIDCIAKAAHGGGYFLGSGCMVPRTTPLANVKAMIDVARATPNSFS
ncbi:MAG: uroporphyrinogen decarboxylase family protein [Caldilineales bacterium]|nr:uroporphyrinogen decarboxylase family protein [Caldilineales bacterium]